MKVKTRRKGFWDVRELNAYQVAYGKPLDYKDYRNYVGLPCLLMSVFSFSICYFWWVALLTGLVGALYGFKVIMPKSVERAYQIRSLKERNRFINNYTNILTNESRTTLKALKLANERTQGELKEDLELLAGRLQGADKFGIQRAFQEISTKYEKDVVFTQYMEQIETAFFEGRNNVDTLKQIKSYHDDIMQKTNLFLRVKDGHFRDMKQMLMIVVVFIASITLSFGFETYFTGFARTIFGWLFGGIYFVIVILLLKSFFTLFFDDEIMSIRRKK